jgi:hypothetical protein
VEVIVGRRDKHSLAGKLFNYVPVGIPAENLIPVSLRRHAEAEPGASFVLEGF